MKLFNKRGAALLQVLLVAAVLAGMATMLLRVSFSRASMSRRTRRAIVSQMLVSDCQAQVNALWASKNQDNFQRDLAKCGMKCTQMSGGVCTNFERTYTCPIIRQVDGQTVSYTVKATFTTTEPNEEGYCPIEYTIEESNPTGVEVPL